MNVYDEYPSRIELEGKAYALDLSYDRVLRVMDIQSMEELTAEDKLAAQCAWLLDVGEKLPRDTGTQARIISAVFELFPKTGERERERYIDFHQDAALIRSGFMRAYGIDLTRESPHFMQFLEMLADLPPDTALMRTVELRQRPIPKPNGNNAQQITELVKAKERVALRVSEEERRESFAESLRKSNVLRR